MAAIGMVMVLAGYSLGLWGYCLIKGYDVSFLQLFKAEWPP